MVKNYWKNMTLFSKLVSIFLSVCLVSIFICASVLYSIAAQSLDRSSVEFASAFGSQMVSSMNSFIERSDLLTKSVLVDSDMIASLDNEEMSISERMELRLELRRMFQRVLTLNADIGSICIITSEQNYYDLESDGASIDVETLLEQEWLQNIIADEGDLFIAPVHNRAYYDRNQDGIVVSVVRKIYSVNGYEGILLMDMEPSALISFSDEFTLARNNYNIKINVTDKNNNILYDSDIASGRVLAEELDQQSLLTYQKNEGDYYIISNATNKLDLKVNIIFPRSSMLLRISQMRVVTSILLIVLTIIVIMLSLMVSSSITKPIRELRSGMAALEKGNYTFIQTDVGGDEVGNLITSYNHMVKKIKGLIEDVYLAEIKEKNAKYLALQTQINPHMLFNTLESIRMKALVSGDDDTADMIKLLAKMFRTALDSDDGKHTVKDEIEYAESYIALQNMRFKDLFILEVDVDPQYYEVALIPIVFQPIIENSIEHGLRDRKTQLRLSIHAGKLGDNTIRFLISDNGKGMSRERFAELKGEIENIGKEDISPVSEKEEGRRSIGIVNITERIKLRYGEEGHVGLVSSDENGTCLEVVIPIVHQ